MTTVQERLAQIPGDMAAAVQVGNSVWLDDLRREQYALWQREQDDAHDRDAGAGKSGGGRGARRAMMATEQWAAICLGCGVKATLYERVEFVCARCHGSIMPLDEPLARAALRGLVAEADAEGTNDDMTLDAVIDAWWAQEAELAAARPIVAAVARYAEIWRQFDESVSDGVIRLSVEHINERIRARQSLFDALARATPDAGARQG